MVSLSDTVIIILDSVKHYKRFYPTCKPVSQPSGVPQKLVEHMAPVSETKITAIHSTIHNMRCLFISSPMGVIQSGPSACGIYSRSVSRLSNPELTKPQFYKNTCSTFALKGNIMFIILVRKPSSLCTEEKHYLYLTSQFTIQMFLKRQSKAAADSKCSETPWNIVSQQVQKTTKLVTELGFYKIRSGVGI